MSYPQPQPPYGQQPSPQNPYGQQYQPQPPYGQQQQPIPASKYKIFTVLSKIWLAIGIIAIVSGIGTSIYGASLAASVGSIDGKTYDFFTFTEVTETSDEIYEVTIELDSLIDEKTVEINAVLDHPSEEPIVSERGQIYVDEDNVNDFIIIDDAYNKAGLWKILGPVLSIVLIPFGLAALGIFILYRSRLKKWLPYVVQDFYPSR